MIKISMKKLTSDKLNNFKEILKVRNHQLLYWTSKSTGSEMVIFCNTHLTAYKTKYANYVKAKFGCKCCSEIVRKAKISQALKGKAKNYRSWLKGRTGQRHPAYKHGLGNIRAKDLTTLNQLRTWKIQVLKNYKYKCFLTKNQNTLQTPLVIHHLNSWCDNTDLRFDINNGVVLLKKIHLQFHQIYGFGKNTAMQFEQYCHDEFGITEYPWKKENHEPCFTLQEETDLKLKFFQKKEKEFKRLCHCRLHKKISGFYETVHSNVVVFCTIHNLSFSTTYLKYKKSKFGCLKCAREKQSQAVSKANRLRNKKSLLNKQGAETNKNIFVINTQQL
jgi:hypothetical protein